MTFPPASAMRFSHALMSACAPGSVASSSAFASRARRASVAQLSMSIAAPPAPSSTHAPQRQAFARRLAVLRVVSRLRLPRVSLPVEAVCTSPPPWLRARFRCRVRSASSRDGGEEEGDMNGWWCVRPRFAGLSVSRCSLVLRLRLALEFRSLASIFWPDSALRPRHAAPPLRLATSEALHVLGRQTLRPFSEPHC